MEEDVSFLPRMRDQSYGQYYSYFHAFEILPRNNAKMLVFKYESCNSPNPNLIVNLGPYELFQVYCALFVQAIISLPNIEH